MAYTQKNGKCWDCGYEGFVRATQAQESKMLCTKCYKEWKEEYDALWGVIYPENHPKK